MKTPLSTRFYQVASTNAWARIWITDDGSISILSDYGNFGHWFGSPGGEFRAFLVGRGDDYLTNKFSEGNQELDAHATELNAKRLVLTARRLRSIDREAAREEWEAVRGLDWSSEYDRCRWYFEETKLIGDYGASHVLVYRAPNRVRYFVQTLWPLFVEQLRAELSREKTLSALAHFP